MVLDVAQLEALLTRTFSIGLDVGRGREKVALVRLRLSRALLGAAETQAMAAGALAIERGVATEQGHGQDKHENHSGPACRGYPDVPDAPAAGHLAPDWQALKSAKVERAGQHGSKA